jgi:hypothetical protein
LYEPSPAIVLPQRPAAVNLGGTTWNGKYNAVNRIFIFEPDGTLSYQATTGKGGINMKIYKNRGTWRQEGTTIMFDYYTTPANVLMQFRGTITDANTIDGEANYPLLKIGNSKQTMKRAN